MLSINPAAEGHSVTANCGPTGIQPCRAVQCCLATDSKNISIANLSYLVYVDYNQG